MYSVIRTQIEGVHADVVSKQVIVQQRQATLQQSRATLADTDRTFVRYQTLANNGAISRQELDTRATTAATAREAVRVAEANIGTAKADVNKQRCQSPTTRNPVRASSCPYSS